MHAYKAFGMTIISEIKISELMIGEGKPDVKILLGPVSVMEDKSSFGYSNYYRLSKSEFTFDIKNVAKFCVKNGDCITVEIYKNADIETVKAYLMGTGMGVLLIQREITAIHGSSIDIDGYTVIFTGECGAGKSTLSSALRKKGYGILADDISVVTFRDEYIPEVQPAFAQQRLCRDTAEILGYDLSALSLASVGEDKFVVDTSDSFRTNAIPLKAIIEIRAEKTESVKLIKITGIDRIRYITRNIYCILLYNQLGLSSSYIQKYIDIAKNINTYSLIRPEGQFTIDEQVQLVVNAVSDQNKRDEYNYERSKDYGCQRSRSGI